MQKILYAIPLILLFPLVVFASLDYSHSTINVPTVPLTIDVHTNDYGKDINCSGLNFWGIQAVEHITGEVFLGIPRFISSEITSQTFTLDLPEGNYEEVTFICSEDGENLAFPIGSLENDLSGDQIIFSTQEEEIVESESLVEKIIDFIGF